MLQYTRFERKVNNLLVGKTVTILWFIPDTNLYLKDVVAIHIDGKFGVSFTLSLHSDEGIFAEIFDYQIIGIQDIASLDNQRVAIYINDVNVRKQFNLLPDHDLELERLVT
jgi:hypothetical protein